MDDRRRQDRAHGAEAVDAEFRRREIGADPAVVDALLNIRMATVGSAS